MRFSERIGVRPIRQVIQTDTMDDRLRNGLWNVFYMWGDGILIPRSWLPFKVVWADILGKGFDEMPETTYGFMQEVKTILLSGDAYFNYDFVESVSKLMGPEYLSIYNNVLEREMSSYRFVNGELAPITNETEIAALEAAPTDARRAGFQGAAQHLDASLALLSDRTAPDYRNAIKEAISAVESAVRVISGDPKAELGKALKAIEAKMPLHGAQKGAFEKLYGYTSDAGGIRHAMLDDPNVDFDDAKYMLVVCSAFVSFLIARASKLGLPVQGA